MSNKPVCIIAEIGVNHNGDFSTAIKMIDVAKESGADIVKFQTSITSTSKYAPKAEYQLENTAANENQFDMIQKLRFSFEQHKALKKYCDEIGIQYLSTPFDFESIDFLNSMDLPFWKVPSGEVVNIPYLIKIGKTKKPVVMSTGMCSISEIESALEYLRKFGTQDITLLHCTTDYPCKYEDVNLTAMLSLKDKFGVNVGYSDHTQGIEVPIAAVALGASVIEKHFTLDRNMEGPDQKASTEPDEFSRMVNSIRIVERSLGDGVKVPRESELKNLGISRKSIVALRNIKKGEIFTEDNIVPRHADYGISPARWFEVIGQVAKRDFLEDEMIEL